MLVDDAAHEAERCVEAVRAALVRDGLDGAARRRVVDVAGQTPLDTLAALLARSSVVVSNDTGVDGDWPPVEDVLTALDTMLVPC